MSNIFYKGIVTALGKKLHKKICQNEDFWTRSSLQT